MSVFSNDRSNKVRKNSRTMSASVPSKTSGESRPDAANASSRVFLNFLAVGSGEVIARLLAFAATLYVARHVGAAGYGVVAFVSGITLYLAKIADFGIETIGADEIAKNRNEITRYGSAILSKRLMVALALAGSAIAVVQLFVPEPERTLFTIYFLTLLPIAASTKWIHMGLESARPVGLWRVAGEAVTLVLVVGFVANPTHLWRIPAAMLIGEMVVAGALLWLLRRQGYPLSLRWNPETAVPVLKRAVPVLIQIVAGLLLYNMNLVFLRAMRSSEAVGFFAASHVPVSFLANICTAYGMTLLPTLARMVRRSTEERSLYHTALAQIFAVTLPISVGCSFLAHRIIQLAYGSAYPDSGPILQILVWVILLYPFRLVCWCALIAHGHQALVLRACAYSVLANVVLNLILIPPYGTYGAAIAAVAAEFVAGALTLQSGVKQGLPMASHSRFWRPIVAVLIMSGTLWALGDVHFVFQLAAGVAAYSLALLSVGGIKLRDGVPALAV
jgi:O-antigen/teichoic acid export membrane protein